VKRLGARRAVERDALPERHDGYNDAEPTASRVGHRTGETVAQRLQRWASTGLIIAGLAILSMTGGLYGYGLYEQYRANLDVGNTLPPDALAWTPIAVAPLATATDAPTPPPAATASPVLSAEAGDGPREGTVRQVVLPTATSIPLPTPTPIPVTPIQRLIATSIGLDTKVVESPIVNGEWTVPKFVAGHLLGTAQPLQGSNIVLSGHVQSISSGNVFARIGELKLGSVIRVYTSAAEITYTVTASQVVPNNDVAVVRPTPNEILTLITCTGTWLPLQHDYDSRIVVIASRQG
jgi:LPXTG-site transpeptidase (sortase) family protein